MEDYLLGPHLICFIFPFLGVHIECFFSVFFISENYPFPSFYTLIPTIGTALVILFSFKKTFITKKLVLGCGTLITTKLIMNYLNISSEIKVNHHPRLFSLYFSKKKWKNKMDFQPSHAKIFGTIGPMNVMSPSKDALGPSHSID